MRIAIYGAGSIGTVVGAYLANDGRDVDLITRNRTHVEALRHAGAHVVGTTEFSAPVRAFTPDDISGRYDLVLLLTKQLENQSVLHSLLPFLGPDGVVCSLQNGIPEEQVASVVGRDRTVGGTVEFGATLEDPGVSRLTSELDHLKWNAFHIGELDGARSSRIEAIAQVLQAVGGTHISENLVGSKWSKLLINNAFSGLSAALGCLYGDVLDNDISARAAVHILDETIRVANATGVRLALLGGFDPSTLRIDHSTDVERHVQTCRVLLQRSRLVKASMLQDLEKGRDTEIQFINGTIPRLAKGTDIPTPFNDLVVELVQHAEQTRTVPDWTTNLTRFTELLQTS